jgi:hypothetical protein
MSPDSFTQLPHHLLFYPDRVALPLPGPKLLLSLPLTPIPFSLCLDAVDVLPEQPAVVALVILLVLLPVDVEQPALRAGT